jgi:hypothetical protein
VLDGAVKRSSPEYSQAHKLHARGGTVGMIVCPPSAWHPSGGLLVLHGKFLVL